MELSIVIPLYNESSHIRNSLKKVENEIKKTTKSFEIIAVDDGSKDETWDVLKKTIDEIPSLHIIKLSRNFGKELAICAGIEASKGRGVIVMDGDLQHPPRLISEMVRMWRVEKKDIVECIKIDRGKEKLKNKLGSELFYWMMKKLTGHKLKGATDFKLMDRKVVNIWLKMQERNVFFRGMSNWLGFNVGQIKFNVEERVDGDTKWNLYSLMKLALTAVVSFSTLPLRFVSVMGMFFLLLSIIMSVYTVYQWMIGAAIEGFTTVIVLQLFIGSLTMISLGVIGEYIAAIYHETKGRPRYIVQERINK